MYRIALLLLIFFLRQSATLSAQSHCNMTPPAPYAVTVTQPDGSKLQVIGKGSAFSNWMETEDGYAVVKSSNGVYEYATLQRGQFEGSGIPASNPTVRSIDQQRQLTGVQKGLVPTVSQSKQTPVQPLTSSGNARLGSPGPMPPNGNVKVLAILIEYPDLKHQQEKESFQKLFNGPSEKPTFKSYFQQNSHNKFNPTVDVVGWYQAKNNYEYYGENNGKGRARELVVEAVKAAQADGVDFSQYNYNNDGNLDGIIVIHSGQGAEEGSQKEYIWSHRWTISPEFVDGYWLQDYTIQPELRVRYNGLVRVGIFCHEFGHLLGLPDLYDTDETDDKHFGIGEWGLMGLGGWLGNEEYPAGMSAFSKQMLGWANVQDITGKGGSYELKPAHSNGQVYKIETPNSNEYFLLENRWRGGTDEYIKGDGLAIWHINTERTQRYPSSIHVNNRKDLKGVDLEEADGNHDLDARANRGDDGDLFPGRNNRTTFDAGTDPNSSLYEDQGNGISSGISLKNIKISGSTVYFDYNKKEIEKGSNCTIAVTAKEGENSLPNGNYWYTFTLPSDGKLIIQNANAEIYDDCDASAPLVSSDEGQLTTERYVKGRTVKIKFGEKQPKTFPLNWKLTVDNKKSDPRLAVESIATKTYGDGGFDLKASSASDGTISYEKTSGPITMEGKKVIIDGAGTAKIKVAVSETDGYAAEEQEISFTINPASLSISFEEVADKTYGDDSFNLVASSQPGFSIAFKAKKGNVSIDGKTVTIIGAGDVEIEASASGDSNHKGASKTISFKVNKASQSISFSTLNDVVFGEGKKIALDANSDRDLPISFTIKEGASKVEGKSLIVQKAGMITIEAYQRGNENISPATSVEQTFEIAKAPQTITFSEIDDKAVGDEPFNLEATSSADIPMEFSIIEGNATLDNNQLKLTGSGVITVEAFNGGNENYQSVQVRQSFVVAEPDKLTQTITVVDLPDTVTINQIVDLGITVSSGLNPDIDLAGDVIRDGEKLTFTQVGEVTVTISQSGNGEYNPAATVAHTFIITNVSVIEAPLGTNGQTIAYQNPDDRVYGDNPFALDVVSSSGLPIAYETDGPVEVSEGMVTILGAGDVTIKAYQNGNEEYSPSDTIELKFTVSKAFQTVTFEVVPIGSNTFRLEANCDSELDVEFSITDGEGSIEGDILTVNSTTATVVASQAGNENYEAANPVSREVSIEVITSVGDEIVEEKAIFYPNPSAGIFHINLENQQQPVNYQIFDINGSIVKQGTLELLHSNIDLTNQRSGAYLIQILVSGNTKRYRLIKQ